MGANRDSHRFRCPPRFATGSAAGNDQFGNRLTKIDNVALLRTDYEYDVYIDWDQQEEYDYPTWHNRLLKYELYDISQTPEQKLRTVNYTYYVTGQASNITIKDEYIDPVTTPGDPSDYDTYHDLALYYHSHGPLWRALWGEYEVDENNEPVEGSYVTLGAREFHYDSPRARHLAVDYDTHESSEPADWTFASAMRTMWLPKMSSTAVERWTHGGRAGHGMPECAFTPAATP